MYFQYSYYHYHTHASLDTGFVFGTYPYKNIDAITNTVPSANCIVKWKSNRYIEATHEMTIATDVANPFSMLSAYLTTTATINPPAACKTTRYQIKPSNPLNRSAMDPS